MLRLLFCFTVNIVIFDYHWSWEWLLNFWESYRVFYFFEVVRQRGSNLSFKLLSHSGINLTDSANQLKDLGFDDIYLQKINGRRTVFRLLIQNSLNNTPDAW